MNTLSYTTAANAFEQGQLALAQQTCESLIAHGHELANAWHLLGLIHFQQNQPQQAVDALKKALQHSSRNGVFQLNLAKVLREQGQFAEALKHLQKAHKYQPQLPDLHYEMGLNWLAQGEARKALYQFEQALKHPPVPADLYFQLGLAAQQLPDLERALGYYQQAYQQQPQHAPSFNNAGFVLQALQRPAEAFHHYKHALDLNPRYTSAAYNLGTLFEAQQEPEKAVGCYQAALRFEPQFQAARSNLAQVYLQLHQPQACLELLTPYLDQLPHPEWLNLAGSAHQALGQPEAAQQAYEKALQLDPAFVGAKYNLGLLQEEAGNYSAAQAVYEEVLAQDPDFAEAAFAQARMLLLQGQMPAGWQAYESRWQIVQDKPQGPSGQEWQAEDLNGKSLLLLPEQGFGDQIQFVRYLDLLKQRYPSCQLTLQTRPALLSLFQTLCQRIEALQVISEDSSPPETDYWLPLLSLPARFASSLQSLPSETPYLSAPASDFSLPSPQEPKALKVGLVWSSGKVLERVNYQMHQRKSLQLAQFAPLLALPDIAWYSLQVGEHALTTENETFQVIDLSPQLKGFGDTAAAIEALDLMISVDTAVAHLAGALNKPVWTLLPYVADWRWLTERDTSPWYPSMRLFRQHEPNNWEAVIRDLCEALMFKSQSS